MGLSLSDLGGLYGASGMIGVAGVNGRIVFFVRTGDCRWRGDRPFLVFAGAVGEVGLSLSDFGGCVVRAVRAV